MCPNEWVEKWDTQREEGRFPGKIQKPSDFEGYTVFRLPPFNRRIVLKKTTDESHDLCRFSVVIMQIKLHDT